MKAARTDSNHADIRDALRDIPGVKVHDTFNAHGGFPDLTVGYQGRTYLLEVKDGSNKLNTLQTKWHAAWTGHKAVVTCIDDALRELGIVR